MSLRLRLIAALAIVSFQIQYAEALLNNCLGPSGVQDFTLFACQPDAAVSTCCKRGDICYSNGLCAPGPSETPGITPFFLNGCTDSSFPAPDCVPDCLTITGNGIQTCPRAGVNHFCCYGFGGCNCSDPNVVFTLKAGSVVTTIDPSATYTASVSSSTSSSPATTTSGSSSTSVSAGSSPAASPANHGVAIGVGVGVSIVGVAAVAGLIYFFYRRGKNSTKASELSAEPIAQPPPFQEYYDGQGQKPQGYQGYQGYPPHQGYSQTQMNELPSDRHYQPVGELPSHPYN